MSKAPFDTDLAEGPDDVGVHWVDASDGVRLRVAIWPRENARGTIVLFPGRTEYVEKYGRVANDFTAAGYAVTAIDWRGQGRADRVFSDPRLGHVEKFLDYQRDVSAYMAHLDDRGVPGPRFLIGHSMGGAIGLRALINGLDVKRAIFSGPMWGIYAPAHIKSFALTLLFLATRLKQAHRVVPGTQVEGHVTGTPFDENKLTRDPEQYEYISRQARSDPAFSLGGPTFHWLREARREIDRLHEAKRPDIPTRVIVGRRDPIVDRKMIESLVASWPSAELTFYENGLHELMHETPDLRNRFLQETLDFFNAA